MNPISFLRKFSGLFLAAGSVTCAAAAGTNVTHLTALQAQKLIAEQRPIILDLRTPAEFAAGHIAGATNINFQAANFAEAIAALDRNQTYLLHCASGNRSTRALPKFQKLEFQSIYHLDGGLRAWQKAGFPVE